MKEQRVLTWLIGLISTDGCISKSSYCNCYSLKVASKEKDWLERIKKTLTIIGIESNIYKKKEKRKTHFKNCQMYELALFNPRKTFKLIQKYPDLQVFSNPRKWEKFKEAFHNYEIAQEHNIFSESEIQFIKDNWKILNDAELHEKLKNHSVESIGAKRKRMNLKKSTYKFWSKREEMFLRENHLKMSNIKLAENFGCSPSCVDRKRKSMNLPNYKRKYERGRKRRFWSKSEIQFVEANWKKLDDKEIGEILGRTKHMIMNKRHSLGLIPYKNRVWTEKEDVFLRDNYGNFTDRELAEKLNRSIYAIKMRRQILRCLRVRVEFWTKEKERFLRENYLEMSNFVLVRKLGCSYSTMQRKRKNMNLSKYVVGGEK